MLASSAARALALVACALAAPVAAGERIYSVDAQQSLLLIHVERGGLAGMFGHEHAVASESLRGEIVIDDEPLRSRAALTVPLTDLVVDKPEHRQAIGLDAGVDAEAIDATRDNMQQRVLETDKFTQADVTVSVTSWDAEEAMLQVRVTLRGVTHDYEVPATLTMDDAVLTASGEMILRHRDFEMKPFRAAAGLLRVGKELKLRFLILAYRDLTDE